MIAALVLVFLAVFYRILGAHVPDLANFSPLMALAFCGAVYFARSRLWLVPCLALWLSDLYLNYYYATTLGYGWDLTGFLVRTACFGAAVGIGFLVARRRNWITLFAGALGGAVLFYLATNTASWAVDPFYAKTPAGLWQALTIGHPQFPPTWVFFRNTLIGDLLFTGIFAAAIELSRTWAKAPAVPMTA